MKKKKCLSIESILNVTGLSGKANFNATEYSNLILPLLVIQIESKMCSVSLLTQTTRINQTGIRNKNSIYEQFIHGVRTISKERTFPQL
jgi:hypothetical protein